MNGSILQLHRIDPQPSAAVRDACAGSGMAAQVVQAAQDLYQRRGYVPPWTCYLAEQDARIVGTCGFTGPPLRGEAEIAYFTFPGNEGQGIARQMAAALMQEARRSMAGHTFIAHTLPHDGPSTAILRRLGFSKLGAVDHPEDGVVWKWREGRGNVQYAPE